MKKTAMFVEIQLDRLAEAPSLRRRIERQLGAAIQSGALPCGCRLPSSRLMARLLNVSRGTVVDAYEALLGTGVLTAKVGSGISVGGCLPSVPNFSKLRRTARAAHFSARVCHLEDWDGTPLYLNLVD